ncbi:MAG TPA: hypothetical protein DDZ39_07610 [Flavobacteriaceae bacterium]|jgi:hypothetical protein|nr:hypothetical protein [Flavobacteriaceae bacterium]HBS11726.1 hypothetical protein [Flavobacteriaceae bacterium]
MKTRFNNYFLSLSLILLIISCTPETVLEDIIDKGDFTAKVNGKNFNADNAAIATEITIHSISGIYSIGMIAADVINVGTKKAIALVMIGSDFDQLVAGKTFTEIIKNEIEGGGGGYSEDITNNNVDIGTDIVESIFIKITTIDKENKLISGEFNFIAIDEDTNKKYTVTDGKFKDIHYTLN